MGPITGPKKGAAEKTAIAIPLSGPSNKSANEPPIRVMGAEKNVPSIKRHTRRVAIFLARAQGIIKITPANKVVAYMILRPSSSESGANNKGPTPKPMTNIVTDANIITSSATPKYSAGFPRPPVTIAEPRATVKHTKPS